MALTVNWYEARIRYCAVGMEILQQRQILSQTNNEIFITFIIHFWYLATNLNAYILSEKLLDWWYAYSKQFGCVSIECMKTGRKNTKTMHTSLKMYKPGIPKTDPPPIRSRSELFMEKISHSRWCGNVPQIVFWQVDYNQ